MISELRFCSENYNCGVLRTERVKLPEIRFL